MSDTLEEQAGWDDRERCLAFSLQAEASHLQTGDGRAIPFTRAILTMHNVCDAERVTVIPHAKLGQEGGTVQDISSSLTYSAPASIPQDCWHVKRVGNPSFLKDSGQAGMTILLLITSF